MASRRFRVLERRVRQIESRLLPTLNRTHLYTDSEYDQVRAYLLLCHAEVEACVEDLAWAVADSAHRRFKTTGHIRIPLVALLAHFQGDFPAVPQSILRPPRTAPPDLHDRVELVYADYRKLVRNNHGIKETNLTKLLFPVGVKEADFPPGWLQTMDVLGADRGECAHRSVASVRQPPDPFTTQQRVNSAMTGLAQIDGTLIRLRR